MTHSNLISLCHFTLFPGITNLWNATSKCIIFCLIIVTPMCATHLQALFSMYFFLWCCPSIFCKGHCWKGPEKTFLSLKAFFQPKCVFSSFLYAFYVPKYNILHVTSGNYLRPWGLGLMAFILTINSQKLIYIVNQLAFGTTLHLQGSLFDTWTKIKKKVKRDMNQMLHWYKLISHLFFLYRFISQMPK